MGPQQILLGIKQASALPADIVAWWKCDEGSGSTLHDSSGNGNDATLYGSPTWTTYSSGINAIRMNGSTQYGDAGNPSVLQFSYASSSKFSVSAWVYSTNTNWNQYIVSKWASNVGYKMSWTGNSKQFESFIQGSSYRIGPSWGATNVWRHIVMIIDTTATGSSDRYVLYLNGSYDSHAEAFNYSGDLADSGTNFLIGLGDTSGGNCTYTDLRVYNTILSSGTISDIYTAGPA